MSANDRRRSVRGMNEQPVACAGHVERHVLVCPPRGHPQGVGVLQHDRGTGQPEPGESLARPEEALSRVGHARRTGRGEGSVPNHAAQPDRLAVRGEKSVVGHERDFCRAVRAHDGVEDRIRIREQPAPRVGEGAGAEASAAPPGRRRSLTRYSPACNAGLHDELLGLKAADRARSSGWSPGLRSGAAVPVAPSSRVALTMHPPKLCRRSSAVSGATDGSASNDEGFRATSGRVRMADVVFHPRRGGRGGDIDDVPGRGRVLQVEHVLAESVVLSSSNHPLMAPAVAPSVTRRWKMRNMTRGTAMAMTRAALSAGTPMPYSPLIMAMPSVRVRDAGF